MSESLTQGPGQTSHPTDRWLLDLADGVGSGPRLEQARAHVSTGCARCVARTAQLSSLREAVSAGPLPAPPSAVARRARALFRRAALAQVAERAFEWIGSLVLDRRAEPVAALRASPGSVRHLLWRLGENELFITLSASGPGWLLQGQFLAAEEDARLDGAVVLVNREGPVVAAEFDPEGYFVIRDVAPAQYRLEGELLGHRFRVPPFEVESSGPTALC